VSQDLLCKQLNYDSNFSEFILLEIECKDNTKLTVGVFYTSRCSTAENDLNLFALISRLCTGKVGNLTCLGDFNWPNIDWSTWTPSSKNGSEFQFIDILRENLNFLNQN